jgi:hypothetical protein
MTVTISIVTKELPDQDTVIARADVIHNILRGHPDYIDSNVVLNIDPDNNKLPAIHLGLFPDSCADRELLRKAAKELIDIALK